MINEIHNPDVLNCLANLSSDEVFTSPKIANEMLDMLPQELFENPNTTFLDPCTKSGVFLREIAKRLLVGLEKQIPNLQERINHIFTKQLYGIAITRLTSLLSRRSVYCSKTANGKYSIVDKFTNDHGNIKFSNCKHVWNEDFRCVFCGVNQTRETYNRQELEVHAYEFLHTDNPKELFNMKFDVIIGNPPYQLNDGGGNGDSARPIYHLFIQQAKRLQPRFLCMIVPSRWMKGGKGLDNFRREMINDVRLEYIFDFEDASECFPGVHIDGGVNYFLWGKDYNGKVKYTYKPKDSSAIYSERFLKTDSSDLVIRDIRHFSIIEKIKFCCDVFFDSIVSSQKPYGFRADVFNHPEIYPEADISYYEKNGYIKLYGVKGIKGGAKRVVGYVNPRGIAKGQENIDKYKILFSKAYSADATIPPEYIFCKPFEICSETFLQIGPFNSEIEALNVFKYMKTKFFRALLFFNRSGMNNSQKTFELIPLLDFNQNWTDEKLYKKYNLTQEEIDFIESMIKPME